MNRRDVIRAAPMLGAAALLPAGARAQAAWPSRPLRWVVGYPAGGAMDRYSRQIGASLAEQLGQPVVVENRPGGGAIVATEQVVRAPADGQTLLSADNGILVFNPALYAQLPFDPDRDLARIAMIARFAMFLIVRRDSPLTDFAALAAAARAGQVSCGSAGIASPHHLAMELVKRRCGMDLLHVPYRGIAGMLPELLAGRLEMGVADVVTAAPAMRTGDIRAIAVLQGNRNTLFPEVPTAAEAGCGGIETGAWFGVCVAAGTPPPIIDRLAEAVPRAIATGPAEADLRSVGAQMIGAGRPEFDRLVQAEIATWRPLIRELGLRPDS